VHALSIPVLSARSVGIFRVVFGLALLTVLWTNPPVAHPVELHRNYSWLADWHWVHALGASATACRVLHLVTVVLAGLFIVGLFTRPMYAALVAAVFINRLIDLQERGTHDWDLPMLTLIALTIVPWGDGFSLDARRRRSQPDRSSEAGPRYGLAIWIPGLMIGLALAAAAYAKLINGGLDWITTGAVRYHFVEDSANAPLTWGLWVAARPDVAVLLSLGVVVVEGAFITNIFVRSPWWRLLAGVVGLSLFVGFYVFQGVLWWPWIMLFTAFLPWALLDRHAPLSGAGRLQPHHAAVVAALVGQQVLMSIAGLEIEPVLSNYPMYSGTYASPAEFEAFRYRKMQQAVFAADGRDVSEQLRDIPNAEENLLDAAEDIAAGTMPDDGVLTILRRLRTEYHARFGSDLALVTVSADRVPFDWEQGVFKPPVRVRIAEVPLPATIESR
jgi:hypothetical protein